MGLTSHGSSARKNQSLRSAGADAGLIHPVSAERILIAQELHDTLLQGFFSLSMQLHDAVEQLPECCTAKPRFRDLAKLCDRVLEEGRSAVQGLRKPVSAYSSLGHALAHVPVVLGLPSQVDFRVIVEGKQRALNARMGDEIYRIGREAIVNAYRHADAGNIETAIEYRRKEIRVAVRDDGRGIDEQKFHPGNNGQWGIQGMRERAERIGARFRIMSRVALGTEVELCVPGRIAFEQA
jgi:signal transduction histidine kinase